MSKFGLNEGKVIGGGLAFAKSSEKRWDRYLFAVRDHLPRDIVGYVANA